MCVDVYMLLTEMGYDVLGVETHCVRVCMCTCVYLTGMGDCEVGE